MVQGDIDPSIPGTGVPVVAFPEKIKNEIPEGNTIYAGFAFASLSWLASINGESLPLSSIPARR
jgi:hypothetical protein